MWSVLLVLCFATCAFAQPGPNATVIWNTSIPNDSWPGGRKYDAFTYDKNAQASLLLSSAIQWNEGQYPPFNTQIIRALDPDTGKIIWSSINEFQIAAWTNDIILTVVGQDSNNIQAIQPLTKKVLWTTNNNVPGMTFCVISGDRFALILNGGILSGGNTLSVFSMADGSLLWSINYAAKTTLQYMVACGTNDFCAMVYVPGPPPGDHSSANVTYFEGATGRVRWSYPGYQAARGSKDSVLIGDGRMFGSQNFVLVSATTGAPIWTMGIENGRYAYDLSIAGDVAHLVVVIVSSSEAIKIQKEKRSLQEIQNAYPCTTYGIRLSDGKRLYQTGPLGSTKGYPSFFDNGDFAMIGSGGVGKFDGATGRHLCDLYPIQDYAISTRPGIDSENDRFFVIGYGGKTMGWDTQQFMALTCPKK